MPGPRSGCLGLSESHRVTQSENHPTAAPVQLPKTREHENNSRRGSERKIKLTANSCRPLERNLLLHREKYDYFRRLW